MVLRSVDISGSEPMDPVNDYYWSEHYQIIQCEGCKTLSFRKLSGSSEDYELSESGDF